MHASDIIHGRRRPDAIAMLVATVIGALFGLAAGVSGPVSEGKPVDVGITLLSVVFCAVALLIMVILIMMSVRTIAAVCRAWRPARVLTGLALVYVAWLLVQHVMFWFIVPSQIVKDVVLGLVMGTIYLLLFTIVLRFIFFIRCAVKGVDDEDVVAANIAAPRRSQTASDRTTSGGTTTVGETANEVGAADRQEEDGPIGR